MEYLNSFKTMQDRARMFVLIPFRQKLSDSKFGRLIRMDEKYSKEP